MPKFDLLATLKQRPVLNDGGMGSQLIAAGLPVGGCSEQWNIDQPDAIRGVHQRYADAGCELLTTNSFGGTSRTLANHGLQDQVGPLNRAAAEIATSVAGDGRLVMGDVGPFGDFLEPMGMVTKDELLAIFTEQIQALKAGGADGINIETMSDPGEIGVAVEAARAVDADWPIMASFCFQKRGDGFVTMMGTDPATAMKSLVDAGADVVGSNCGTELSLDDYVRLAGELCAGAGQTPVVLSPNAGAPQMVDGQVTYVATPDDMASYVSRFLDAGVRVLGGCCGTTPDHLAAMKKAMP